MARPASGRTFLEHELFDQPRCWRQAAITAAEQADRLPQPGERVAVVGCGTSWFMAMSYAGLREASGAGLTDAYAGSEFPRSRTYDRLLVISRSGTTTEVLELLGSRVAPVSTALTAVPDSPIAGLADHTVLLDYADEESVVQTRFATTALTVLRASLGTDVEPLAHDAERALEVDVTPYVGAEQTSYLGRGWTIGLAHEAALKCREAAQSWAEAYPAMDYRHGPIAIAQPGRLVWAFGEVPDGLVAEVERTGAEFVAFPDLDAQANLVVAQRVALARAVAAGLDPDHPRSLTRSVILDPRQ